MFNLKGKSRLKLDDSRMKLQEKPAVVVLTSSCSLRSLRRPLDRFGVRWQARRDTALDRANHPKRRRRPDKSGLCRRTPNYFCGRSARQSDILSPVTCHLAPASSAVAMEF